MDQKQVFNLALVGDVKVGKHQIWNRFLGHEFSDGQISKERARSKDGKITRGKNTFFIQLWNTAPVSFFDNLGKSFLHESDVVAIVLDGTKSLEEQAKSMSYWFAKIKKSKPNALIYFMVNKTDVVPGFIDEDTCRKGVKEWNEAKKRQDENHQDIPVMFCSAKNNAGINEAFTRMANDCVAKRLKELSKETSNTPTSPHISSSNKTPSHIKTYVRQSHFLKELKEKISDNKVRVRGSVFFLMVLILLLIIAAFPFGSFLALGSLSAVAVAGLIGGGGLLLWNVGCSVVNDLREKRVSSFDEIDAPPVTMERVSSHDERDSNVEVASYRNGQVYPKRSEQEVTGVPLSEEQQDPSKQQQKR